MLITHFAKRCDRQAFLGSGGPRHVTAQAFELVALAGFGGHAGMQAETGHRTHRARNRFVGIARRPAVVNLI